MDIQSVRISRELVCSTDRADNSLERTSRMRVFLPDRCSMIQGLRSWFLDVTAEVAFLEGEISDRISRIASTLVREQAVKRAGDVDVSG